MADIIAKYGEEGARVVVEGYHCTAGGGNQGGVAVASRAGDKRFRLRFLTGKSDTIGKNRPIFPREKVCVLSDFVAELSFLQVTAIVNRHVPAFGRDADGIPVPTRMIRLITVIDDEESRRSFSAPGGAQRAFQALGEHIRAVPCHERYGIQGIRGVQGATLLIRGGPSPGSRMMLRINRLVPEVQDTRDKKQDTQVATVLTILRSTVQLVQRVPLEAFREVRDRYTVSQ